VAVTAVTVAVVVATDNLADGVFAGVLLAALLFARRVAHLVDVRADPVAAPGGGRRYAVHGQLFFASTEALVHAFDYGGGDPHVEIDLSAATVWDSSAVAALDGVVARFAARGVVAELVGLDARSGALHGRLTGRFGAGG
jgi:SulP family sulfate permease